ncbi:uncharacterized protein RCH25_008073 [Pelodytes ibericus]
MMLFTILSSRIASKLRHPSGLEAYPVTYCSLQVQQEIGGFFLKIMAPRGLIHLLILVMILNFCSSHWMENRDRRMPPPVMSFLEKLKSLRAQGSTRDVREVDKHSTTDNENMEHSVEDQTGDSIDNSHIPLRSTPHLREKRYISSISMRGCHLGTCQIQNLASMLYRIGNNNYKDGSNKDTKDPLSYGRKRRSLTQIPKRTDLLQKLLVT